MENQISTTGSFSLAPQNLSEAMQLAEIMSNSQMVPKDFQGKPGNVLVAVQMGADIGLAPMQAIQNIAVINGRPALWGDAVKAIVLASPLCEKFEESIDESTMTAYTKVKRKGHEEKIISFSQADAVAANLWGKSGPWTQYPKRMLQMRSRGFAARDEFADVLKGLSVAEELQDTPIDSPNSYKEPKGVIEKDVTPERELYPLDQFETNFPRWLSAIESGKKTAKDIITMIETKGALSDDQKTLLEEIPVIEGEAS